MKTLMLLSALFILTVACGQSATPEPPSEPPKIEPTSEHPRTVPVTQPAPTMVVEESPPTNPTEPPAALPTKRKDWSDLQDANRQIPVGIYLDGDNQEENILDVIKTQGGEPRNVSPGYIEAYVPSLLVTELLKHPAVARVQKIIPPNPN